MPPPIRFFSVRVPTMDRPAVTNLLSELTGTWSTGPAVATSELGEARTALASAFASGLRSDDLSAPSVSRLRLTAAGEDLRPLETIVAMLKPGPAPDVRPFVRSAADLDPASRANIAGMKVARTLGPFVNELGIDHFVDLIPLTKKIPIETAGSILALLELETLAIPLPKTLQLGVGSLWIAVRALVGGTSAGFVGLAFSKAVAEFTNVHAAPGGALLLKAGSKLTLQLTLEHPPAQPPAPPIGVDASNMVLNLPAHVTFVFETTGATVSALDDSSATVYSTAVALKRNAVQPRVDSLGLSYVLVPCDVSTTSFVVGTCA